MRMVLLFQRETNTFHCFTNGSFVNVITCHGSDATLEVNGYGLNTFDGTDDFLDVGTAMVAGHALDHIGLGFTSLLF